MAGSIVEVAAVFLKIGLVAVGGPAVHVAMMAREVVNKRHWVTEKEFLDDFAACQLIPGPSSTELAILLGYRRAGLPGLVIAGTLFILPAMLIMLALAWIYTQFAGSAVVSHVLSGVRPVVVAVIAWAIFDLGRRIVRGALPALLVLAVMAAGLVGINPIALLVAGGLVFVLRLVRGRFYVSLGTVVKGVALNSSLIGLFLTFLKYGLVSFGSGYVLFAFLHTDVVQNFHWMTTSQLIDAIAISQATPGPVFTVATFIGFFVAGVGGALAATVGIFLPGFVLVPFLDRIVRLVNERQWARGLLDGVNVAALGLIATVAIQIGRSAFVDPITVIMAVIALGILVRVPLAAPGLVIAGGLLGLVGIR
ncbi:MAG TPA: chromate efflux transporter [Candidatus Acidoferrum sp.]|nr:chromate efflux transporter [Candidatus Acidoferrum sp.]